MPICINLACILGMTKNTKYMALKYNDKEFDIGLHESTDINVFIDYFYHQIMKRESNKVKSEGYIIPPENGLNDKSLNELQEILDKTGTRGYMGEDC